MKKKFILCFLAINILYLWIFTTILPNQVLANQFITIVNPIRISTYSIDPPASLKAQYLEVQKRNLAATWLLSYDVISDPGTIAIAKTFDKTQELGLFLEISPKFASESAVLYNKTDSWHRANSVFLSGYTQEDRIRLIDEIFRKFKESFGYYPVSVGAWWIDSYSLQYMQQKYAVTANLNCADQFSTDGYQIWGQFWSTPFYPSNLHAGMPAPTLDSKLDLITIQWAARDPLNGYGREGASLFSTQDYHETPFFQKLINLYAKSNNNKFGQLTMGLEGDFSPESYGGFFASQLDVVKAEKEHGSIKVVTMKDFSNWYRSNFKDLSPVQIIQTDDFLGKKIKTIWYNSPKFRVNILYNTDTKETIIRDLRVYHDNFQEPYYISPNRDLNLSINLPSQIDSASNPEEIWTVFKEELERVDINEGILILNYKNGVKIKLTKDGIEFFGDIKDMPKQIKDSSVQIKKLEKELEIIAKTGWNYPPEGLVFRALSQEGTFFLKQKKVIISGILGIIILTGLVLLLNKKITAPLYKRALIIILMLLLGGISYKWYLSNSKLYFVNQSELDALNRLKVMDGKKVVVYDKVCLQCSWHTALMPAVFANKRDYVKKVSGKEVIYNSSIFNAKTRPEAKKELDKLKADYIYLVRFEDYRELAPFSPGDLNIEEIYSNANSQIWKVKKS